MEMLPDYIKDKLKEGPEQTLVVGPLVDRLIKYGWAFEQIVFGKNEWKVPKTPLKRQNVKKARHLTISLLTLQFLKAPKRAVIIDISCFLLNASSLILTLDCSSLKHICLWNLTSN